MFKSLKARVGAVLGLAVVGASVATPAFATGGTIDTSAGTSGLTDGVTAMTSFVYGALPILLGLAVAAAVVGWVIRKVGRAK